MGQASFAELEHDSKKRRTRREKLLEKMDGLIPWARPEARVEPFWSGPAHSLEAAPSHASDAAPAHALLHGSAARVRFDMGCQDADKRTENRDAGWTGRLR